ncbi:MAG: hypothetical protein Q8P61_08895 [Candidatus Nanopelagicales bacterium]|nr:hypothetical protein [Candidatus Nanopelagicales bacterium]
MTLFPTAAGASMTIVTPPPSGRKSVVQSESVKDFGAQETIDDDQVLVELIWN